MLTFSTETAFFLALFELVVSGLQLGAMLWIRFREKARFPGQGALIAAFTLTCGGFAAQAIYYRIVVPPVQQDAASLAWVFFAADATRAVASLTLGAAFLLIGRRRRFLRLYLFTGSAFILMGAFVSAYRPGPVTIDPATGLRLADVAVLAIGAISVGWRPGLAGLALALFGLGRASAFVAAIWPRQLEACWTTGIALVVTALLLVALKVERLSRARLLHYVLRFNLTFLTLAISLTVALTEITRQQFIEFSATQIHDLGEFARGYLVHGSRAGKPPMQTLAEPAIAAGIIREFGRYPDLRRVQLELGGQAMAIEIHPTGEVGQESWTGKRTEPPALTAEDFTHSLLLCLPVVVDGRRVGQVSLYHSVVRINSQLGRQMQVAFGVFTVFVVLGSIVTGILVLVADRTIRRQERELAEAQNRLLGAERLASIGAVADGVAHEINNPVGVLVARSDYLLNVIRGKPYETEIQDDLDTIRRQSQRVAKTVQDLLVSTRRARQMKGRVDIAAVVDSAIKLVRPVVRDRGVTFEFRQGPRELCVWGDHDRLEQVFINLLSNAAQAIPGRGAVTVEAWERHGGQWIDVEVADTGTGIEPELIPRIFDRFFTTKEPGSGSGLGLSIVSGVVRDHGGYIEVKSTLGKGSRFRITLCAYDSVAKQLTSAMNGPANDPFGTSGEVVDG